MLVFRSHYWRGCARWMVQRGLVGFASPKFQLQLGLLFSSSQCGTTKGTKQTNFSNHGGPPLSPTNSDWKSFFAKVRSSKTSSSHLNSPKSSSGSRSARLSSANELCQTLSCIAAIFELLKTTAFASMWPYPSAEWKVVLVERWCSVGRNRWL